MKEHSFMNELITNVKRHWTTRRCNKGFALPAINAINDLIKLYCTWCQRDRFPRHWMTRIWCMHIKRAIAASLLCTLNYHKWLSGHEPLELEYTDDDEYNCPTATRSAGSKRKVITVRTLLPRVTKWQFRVRTVNWPKSLLLWATLLQSKDVYRRT